MAVYPTTSPQCAAITALVDIGGETSTPRTLNKKRTLPRAHIHCLFGQGLLAALGQYADVWYMAFSKSRTSANAPGSKKGKYCMYNAAAIPFLRSIQ